MLSKIIVCENSILKKKFIINFQVLFPKRKFWIDNLKIIKINKINNLQLLFVFHPYHMYAVHALYVSYFPVYKSTF